MIFMQKIKFRAWDENIMREVVAIDWEFPSISMKLEDGSIVDEFYGANLPPEERTITTPLMQYTGLQDDNGTAIYDGDIVEMMEEAKVEPTKRLIVEVGTFGERMLRLVDSRFYVAKLEDGIRRNDISTKLKDGIAGKIIGNIYANPELLKEAL